MSFTVERILGLTPSPRRAVVFLADAAGELDASSVFNGMADGKNPKRDVRNRFDFWIAFGKKDDWFHGWPNHQEFKNCFVFKWHVRNVGQRLYGFLCHPQPSLNPAFQLCVLHTYDTKTEAATELKHLRLANRLRVNNLVNAAIQMHFPDLKPGEKRWNN